MGVCHEYVCVDATVDCHVSTSQEEGLPLILVIDTLESIAHMSFLCVNEVPLTPRQLLGLGCLGSDISQTILLFFEIDSLVMQSLGHCLF